MRRFAAAQVAAEFRDGALTMGNVLVWVIWLAAAAACIGTGLRVVTASNPFSSALSLIGNLASLAVLYLLAAGEFVAVAQVLVYAGAVMVMFLFVIAYLGGRADAPWAGGTRLIQTASVIAAASLLAVTLVAILLDASDRLSDEADIGRAFGTPSEIGRLFLTDHLLAFEITSIVLLVAAVGGVVLGMRSEAENEVDPGEAVR
jgi:NADH:ubiquinone oxidoreductase subunit 6 (subunit J)